MTIFKLQMYYVRLCFNHLQVAERGREIAQCFAKERFATKRELNNLSRLAVDASQIFPPDFVSAIATVIYASVSNMQLCSHKCLFDYIKLFFPLV